MPQLLTALPEPLSNRTTVVLEGYTHTLGSNPMAPGRHRAVMSRIVTPLKNPALAATKLWASMRSELYDQAGFPICGGGDDDGVQRYLNTIEAVFNADITVCRGWRCGQLAPSVMPMLRESHFLVHYSDPEDWGSFGNCLSVVWIGDRMSIPIRRPEYYSDPRGCRWGLSYQWIGGDDNAVTARLTAAFTLSMLTVGEFRRTARIEIQPGLVGRGRRATISVSEDDFLPTGDDALMRPIDYLR